MSALSILSGVIGKSRIGRLYLTSVIDLADRKLIGYSFSSNMTAKNMVIAALNIAVKTRGVQPGLVFHSDRGVQYAGKEFTTLLKSHEITQSMSRKANCW